MKLANAEKVGAKERGAIKDSHCTFLPSDTYGASHSKEKTRKQSCHGGLLRAQFYN